MSLEPSPRSSHKSAPSAPPPTERPKLDVGLEQLWLHFLPEFEARMTALETAARSFNRGRMSAEQHAAAHAAAHKLAGVLGSFGLTRGTVLARELEILYSRENARDELIGEQLNELTAELRRLLCR